jgi:hypothetical protein
MWTAARHVTCAVHAQRFSIARRSHAANAYAFEISNGTRLPTAILPARATVEAPDRKVDLFFRIASRTFARASAFRLGRRGHEGALEEHEPVGLEPGAR